MTTSALFVCRDPHGAHWRLGPLPAAAGRVTLIGWSTVPASPDAGVPEAVASVLARALTAVARVTFPSSDPAGPQDGDSAPGQDRYGWAGRLGKALGWGAAGGAPWSTRRPETARRLFDDAGYPWWLQGQVALLSAPDAPPPEIDAPGLLGLLADDWAVQAAALTVPDLRGVLRPGVDGDLAGLLSLGHDFEPVFLAALEAKARSSGFGWSLLTERAFADHLAAR